MQKVAADPSQTFLAPMTCEAGIQPMCQFASHGPEQGPKSAIQLAQREGPACRAETTVTPVTLLEEQGRVPLCITRLTHPCTEPLGKPSAQATARKVESQGGTLFGAE